MITQSNAVKIWNTLRIVSLGIVVALTVFATARGYSHVIDVKLPSSHSENQKWEDKERRGLDAYNRLQKALEENRRNIENNENEENSNQLFEEFSGKDYSEAVDYESNHCG